jgi:hypothetical protein
MDIPSFVSRYGVWISIPAFVLSVFSLVLCITGVVRTVRRAWLFSVPLVERQEIEFADAGTVVLSMEGPMLSRRFAGLEYEIAGPYGMAVQGRRALFRARTTGFTKARMELRVYEITHPGRHIFSIRGLGSERPSDAEHRMVFTRPHLRYSMAYVVGIVFAGMFTIGSIVLFFLSLGLDGSGS